MTRRINREDLFVIACVAAASVFAGVLMVWAFTVIGWGLDAVGLTTNGVKGAYFRAHPWQSGLAIGSMLGVLVTGSSVLDLGKEIGWRNMVPSFVWPATQKAETTVAVRLGRVLHWITVALAAAMLAITVYMWIDEESRIPAAQQAHAAWEARHPIGADGYRVGRNDMFDYEPSIPNEEFGPYAAAAAIAALLALFGRGLRYIIAGE